MTSYTIGAKRVGAVKWKFQLQVVIGKNKTKAFTGWAELTAKEQSRLNELIRMANLGRKVPLSQAYAMFPSLP